MSREQSPNQMKSLGQEFGGLLQELRTLADEPEAEHRWPQQQLQRLAECGVLGWAIPREYGGSEIAADEMLAGYEGLAQACLVTAFVLTQRNGACQRIAASDNATLRSELLPKLARGEHFATVGISHLTTSRQHLARPAVAVWRSDGGYVLSGSIPWVTGAAPADIIVTGGTCDDGRQILAAVPTRSPGVHVNPPPTLLALNGSQTTSVDLDEVFVEEEQLIAGPVEQMMKTSGGGGAGSLTTSALAIGAAAGVIQRLQSEAQQRAELRSFCDGFNRERQQLSNQLHQMARGGSGQTAVTAEALRQRANSLVTRTAQAYLTVSKGAGFVSGHPAERAVREAMFFLVWSCPQPVLKASLEELACGLGS